MSYFVRGNEVLEVISGIRRGMREREEKHLGDSGRLYWSTLGRLDFVNGLCVGFHNVVIRVAQRLNGLMRVFATWPNAIGYLNLNGSSWKFWSLFLINYMDQCYLL
ncbi:OLC1v1018279C1 [Oldenlandia corymbosa var. corymbosa]|uniref:OLC1v1018279C1 n=1 Tax=Oldenlandia corymbosa var. corymbosa TaxID=529605 RepID=A0AAV1EBA1_OLDCO|nr:OLC1v1018279C1 [Oldenlandia corymbosa var. corymbosa]